MPEYVDNSRLSHAEPPDGISFNYDKRSALHYLRRRVAAALGKRSPFVAYLKVTRRCNLDCPYCPWHSHSVDFAGELDTAAWKRIIDDLHSRGVRIFVIEGGEPTLRRDLRELLDHTHSLGGYTILATNATTRMPLFHPSAFSVSIDGPRDVHDRVRGCGSYDRLRQNLEARRGKEPVLVITVISRENQRYLAQTVEEIAPLVSGFLFTFIYPYQANRMTLMTSNEIAAAKREILTLKKRGFSILNPRKQLQRQPGEWRCHDFLTNSVDHRGNIRSGCFVEHAEPRDCAKCHLACYQLLSALHDFSFEAWFSIHRFLLRAI